MGNKNSERSLSPFYSFSSNCDICDLAAMHTASSFVSDLCLMSTMSKEKCEKSVIVIRSSIV